MVSRYFLEVRRNRQVGRDAIGQSVAVAVPFAGSGSFEETERNDMRFG